MFTSLPVLLVCRQFSSKTIESFRITVQIHSPSRGKTEPILPLSVVTGVLSRVNRAVLDRFRVRLENGRASVDLLKRT